MRFGIQITHQLPRPWEPDAEGRMLRQSLDQVELADRLGLEHVWVVEQHFLEEYSHSSAPEVFLAAASQRTRRIRLGFGVALTPPAYNAPVRTAERIATLDAISGGRVEFGAGNSKSRMELEGFGIDAELRQEMSLEALKQIAHMLALDPYPGHHGRHFSMPPRNVVPKPTQRPHPPLWLACSDDRTRRLAGHLGMGALTHSPRDIAEARQLVSAYYASFAADCRPLGHSVNPNVATLIPFFCHAPGDDEAARRAHEAHGFFTFAVRHYYRFGQHRPGRTDLRSAYRRVLEELGGPPPVRGMHLIGTPDELRNRLRELADAGVDQVVLLHQVGDLPHEEVCASLELAAENVLPRFQAEEAERSHRKDDALAPLVRAATQQRQEVPLTDEDIPSVDAYGRLRPPIDIESLPREYREQERVFERLRRLADRDRA